MIFDKLASKKCLFLICPTDHIEGILNKINCKKTYFYTALGASFSWDITTQQNLITVIENKKIECVIFITKNTNRFYIETNEPAPTPIFRINQALMKLDKTLPNCFLEQSHPMLRIMLRASRHLQRQDKYILETSMLGKVIKERGIVIKSYVYQSATEVFYTPNMIEKKVLLYGKLSPN